jgi:DNA-binding SARP family transcriptional activator
VEFRILGPLEVRADGRPLALGGIKQRALLAALLLNAGRVVPADRLVEDLWGEVPPDTATSTLWVHVARLRKALDPGRARGTSRSAELLVTRAPGYLLRVGPGELDLERFHLLAAQARQQRTAGRLDEAAGLLRQALGLWRGPALADLATEPFAQGHIARLEESRLSAIEERVDVELALAGHSGLIGELEELAAAHPFREGLRARLMLALYRSGRQADALEVYRQTRKTLADELGIEAGPALQRLEGAILAQDPSLEWAPPSSPAAPEPLLEEPAEPGPGGPPSPAAGPVDIRKPVTVLRVGIAVSAVDGELDPESQSSLGDRYLDGILAVVNRHGGTVQELTPETVAAVFGVPQSFENDAVRAVRAAADVRSVLERAGGGLERDRGVRLDFSAGVETGEVIVRPQQHEAAVLVGSAPRLARRLEQAASPGQLLLGPTTYSLVRDAVQVEEGPPIGQATPGAPTRSWRLVLVNSGMPGRLRRPDAPMVGRSRELTLLTQLFERTLADRTCHMVTVIGPAGIGKSRLVHELLADADARATVLHGRCLDYGDGITFWPIAEMARQAVSADEAATPVEVRAGIANLLAEDRSAQRVAGQIAGLLGLTDGTPPADELPWAFRKLLEALARQRPLVVVLDDLHWAEPALLDLVEHLADFTRGVPLLLVCVARPDLFEVRSGWGGGKMNATSILLEPLNGPDCAQLVDNLLGPGTLPAAVRTRLSEAADGNPLFAEELVAVLIEDGVLVESDGSWRATADLAALPIPPTISALLTARLDLLGVGERGTIERASIVGKEFSREAVIALSPASARAFVDAHLQGLTRKELIRPDRSSPAGQDAYHFRHLLIRDAAYASLPKLRRAELHLRFADWLEAGDGDHPGDAEEIGAYHLEQACRYRQELDVADLALVHRAANRLTAAGQRASDRWDHQAATSLLTRARALLPADSPAGLELLPGIIANLGYQGRLRQARELAGEGIELARIRGERRLEAKMRIEQQLLTWTNAGSWAADEAHYELQQALPLFEQANDARGLAAARLLVARLEMLLLRCAAVEQHVRQVVLHSRLVGDSGRVRLALNLLGITYLYGPTPVPEAISRCEDLEREAGDNHLMGATIRGRIACLEAMRRNFRRAEALLGGVATILDDMGSTVGWIPWATHREDVALVASLRGDHVRAEASFRASRRALEEAGATLVLSTELARLADTLYEQHRDEEAEDLTTVSEEMTTREDDLLSQFLWRGVRSKVLARRGRIEEALPMAEEAVELAERTDALNEQGAMWLCRAEVLRLAGDRKAASGAVAQALDRYERKGNLASGDHARQLLAQLQR